MCLFVACSHSGLRRTGRTKKRWTTPEHTPEQADPFHARYCPVRRPWRFDGLVLATAVAFHRNGIATLARGRAHPAGPVLILVPDRYEDVPTLLLDSVLFHVDSHPKPSICSNTSRRWSRSTCWGPGGPGLTAFSKILISSGYISSSMHAGSPPASPSWRSSSGRATPGCGSCCL